MSSETSVNRVLITGAGGYLGSLLTRHLAEQRYPVRALVRAVPAQPLAGVEDTLDWHTASNSPATLSEFLAGVTNVVHLASSSSAALNQQREVHVEMPQKLMAAAADAGVQRFIATSSVKAIASEAAGAPLGVDATPEPASDYGRCKLQAEELIRTHPANAQLASWVLRLPMVYGGGERGNFGLLCKVARAGLPLPVATDNRRSVLYTKNLFACIERLMDEPADPGCTTLHLADHAALSTKDLFQLIAGAQNKSGRCIGLSTRWAERLAAVPVLGGLSARLLGSLELSLESLAALPGWQAPFDTAAAIAAEFGASPPAAADKTRTQGNR